jgi:HSP20 family protein
MATDLEVSRTNPDRRVSAQTPGFSPFDQMIDRFFGDRVGSLFSGFPEIMRAQSTWPNVQELDDAYCLCVDVPGIPKENIELKVAGNMLTIHAEDRKSEESKEGRPQTWRQRTFHQSFTLPTNLDADKIEAHCENGVLEVLIPKMAESKGKKIEIQSGKGGILGKLFKKDRTNEAPSGEVTQH